MIMIISVPVNPGCSCLLSVGGLYIDSAYYQPQTIATPIIIHLGPQDLFWPLQCTETGFRNRLDLPFNPSPLIKLCQLMRCRSPGFLSAHDAQQQYWKQYRRRQHPGQRKSRSGFSKKEAAVETVLHSACSENVNKTQSNILFAFRDFSGFKNILNWISNRPSAPAHSQQCDILYVNTFNICTNGCACFEYIYTC